MDKLEKDIPFPLRRVVSDPRLPHQADVVIIGGGIIGAAAAYYLSKKGHRVALIEKGLIGAEQSSRNWGWVRQQNRDERELPLAKWALDSWGTLTQEIGDDLGFRREGLVYLTDDPKELAGWEAWVNMARTYQVHSHLMSKAEAAAMMPGGKAWVGGVRSPTDGRAEPSLATAVIAEAARRLGATIHQNCAARGMETEGGKVGAVVTELGRIRTSQVLCAAGAWASLFCRWHGIDFPQSGVRATAFATGPGPTLIEGGLSTPQFTVRRRMDGGYTVAARGRGRIEITPQGLRYTKQFLPILRARWSSSISIGMGRSFFSGPEALARWSLDSRSPFEKMRVLNPAADQPTIDSTFEELVKTFPAFGGLGVASKWAGWIDSTPDAVAVIGPVPQLPGFFIASGFSGHGFGVGPAAGRLAADLIAGDAPIVDPHPLRFTRFSEGEQGPPAAM
jgi:glycine/D-amino acid oxidase-like deaminating enzyme